MSTKPNYINPATEEAFLDQDNVSNWIGINEKFVVSGGKWDDPGVKGPPAPVGPTTPGSDGPSAQGLALASAVHHEEAHAEQEVDVPGPTTGDNSAYCARLRAELDAHCQQIDLLDTALPLLGMRFSAWEPGASERKKAEDYRDQKQAQKEEIQMLLQDNGC